jgi:hypothetical protein
MGEYADLCIDSGIGDYQSGEEDAAFIPRNDYRGVQVCEIVRGEEYLLRNFSETYNKEVRVLNKTTKAVLFRLKTHEFWIPISVLKKRNREGFKYIIYVPDWCNITIK